MAALVRFDNARPKPQTGLRSSVASDGPDDHSCPGLPVGKDLSTAFTIGRSTNYFLEWTH
jgi:hypothetical protein